MQRKNSAAGQPPCPHSSLGERAAISLVALLTGWLPGQAKFCGAAALEHLLAFQACVIAGGDAGAAVV